MGFFKSSSTNSGESIGSGLEGVLPLTSEEECSAEKRVTFSSLIDILGSPVWRIPYIAYSGFFTGWESMDLGTWDVSVV